MNTKTIRWLGSGIIIFVLSFLIVGNQCSSDSFGLCAPFLGMFLLVLSIVLLLVINLEMGVLSRFSLLFLFIAFILPRTDYFFKEIKINYSISLTLFLLLTILSLILSICSLIKKKDSRVYSLIALIIAGIFISQIVLGLSIYSNQPLTSKNIKLISSNSKEIVLELSAPSKLLYPNKKLSDIRCDLGGPTKSGGRFSGKVYNLNPGINELSVPQDNNTYDKICCWGYSTSIGNDKMCYSISK